MTDDDPITLAHACEVVFAGKVTPWTLRAEAGRGNLDIFMIGKRQFTTLRSVREMVEKCRVVRPVRGSISTAREGNGLSETDQRSFALARAQATVERLKGHSKSTSPRSTARHRAPTH